MSDHSRQDFCKMRGDGSKSPLELGPWIQMESTLSSGDRNEGSQGREMKCEGQDPSMEGNDDSF